MGISKLIFLKTLTIIQKTLIGAKYLANSIGTKSFHFFGMYCNKFWEISQIELHPYKGNQESWKPLPKFRKYCLEQILIIITWWIPMNQSVLTLLICTATNYKQRLQTKLHLDIWKKGFTKTLTKLQKTLIGVNYTWPRRGWFCNEIVERSDSQKLIDHELRQICLPSPQPPFWLNVILSRRLKSIELFSFCVAD